MKVWTNLLAWRIGVFGSLLVGSWCVMVTTHEAGHIVGGWLSGAKLTQADLRPWTMPYSIFDPNPMPLVTLWSGPILGSIIPLIAACAFRKSGGWFVAWFCVLSNGIYITGAWVTGDQHLDTTQMLEAGGSTTSITIFCTVALISGYIGFRKSCLQLFADS